MVLQFFAVYADGAAVFEPQIVYTDGAAVFAVNADGATVFAPQIVYADGAAELDAVEYDFRKCTLSRRSFSPAK